MRRLLQLFILSIFYLTGIHAQELNVKSFVVKTNDITARTQPRKDINGNDCALVKVQLAASNAVFEGNVIGDVVYNTSEYLVYMAQGSKRLTIKLEGYLPLDVNFEDFGINSLEGKTVYVMTISGVTGTQQLEAPKTKTGWIILDSEPSGASVYINDEFVGNTPLSNYKQAYGTYQYRLESLNYHSATGIIELNEGRFEQKVVLKPAFGSISVNSSISGARIILDGKQTGKQTPATLTEIPSGSHTITLQMDKYAPRQQEVIVEDGQTANVSMSLDARFARISINSLDGAEIYSNGKLLGKGRISDDMMEGYYDLEARLNHHKSATKQIQVVAGQAQDITINPIPKYGSLDVMSTPYDADITIDGKPYGKTPFTVEQLLEGDHTIAISKKGFSSFKKVVSILEGKTETISATLEEGAHIKTNNTDKSITVSGHMTDKEWEKLRVLCKTNRFKTVDLSNAECSSIPPFSFNSSSLTSIIIPNGVTNLEYSAFYGCTSLRNFTIPNSVIAIGPDAFWGCSSLESIIIPNSVKTINERAFQNCNRLLSITIPNTVTCIGNRAFHGTKWYENQTNGVAYLGAFAYCYKGEEYMPNEFEIILKEGTIGIVDGAFSSCFRLASIIIPSSITYIGEQSFRSCISLKNITIREGLKYIGKGAFMECISLTSISVPKSVNTIDDDTFYGCRNLTSITIPNGVTSIGHSAFADCRSLTSITIPNSVTDIGESAFSGCNNLTMYVPKGALKRFNKMKIGAWRIKEVEDILKRKDDDLYIDKSTNEAETQNSLFSNGTIRLVGTVSSYYNIHMVLEASGNHVTGYYYYDSQGSNNRVKLDGDITENNSLKLKKYDKKGRETGYFEGTFDNKTYSGLNTNYDRNSRLPFAVEIIK